MECVCPWGGGGGPGPLGPPPRSAPGSIPVSGEGEEGGQIDRSVEESGMAGGAGEPLRDNPHQPGKWRLIVDLASTMA